MTREVNKKSPFLADILSATLYHTKVDFRELKEETELKLVAESNGLRVIGKAGMTQGMPYSPVAANLALKGVEPHPQGLVMYADDGLVMTGYNDLDLD